MHGEHLRSDPKLVVVPDRTDRNQVLFLLLLSTAQEVLFAVTGTSRSSFGPLGVSDGAVAWQVLVKGAEAENAAVVAR